MIQNFRKISMSIWQFMLNFHVKLHWLLIKKQLHLVETQMLIGLVKKNKVKVLGTIWQVIIRVGIKVEIIAVGKTKEAIKEVTKEVTKEEIKEATTVGEIKEEIKVEIKGVTTAGEIKEVVPAMMVGEIKSKTKAEIVDGETSL